VLWHEGLQRHRDEKIVQAVASVLWAAHWTRPV
jgi:hypothetical protein